MNIFVSSEAQQSLQAWYPRFLAKVGVQTEERMVSNRFGDTHVLIAGPPDAPPLIAFHGAMATSAHMMNEIAPLLSRFRVYAPDVLGHSPMSADARPAIADYGAWATDLLDGLHLDSVLVCGVSYGGLVTLRLLTTAPQRVKRVALVVPGGLVSGSVWASITKLAIPMTMYRWFPTEERLRTFLEPQITNWDDDWAHWLGDAIRGFKLNFNAPPLTTREELAGFQGKALVFGASDDIHFPGPALLKRAKEVFSCPLETELIEDCRHSPPFNDAFRQRLTSRIADFLTN